MLKLIRTGTVTKQGAVTPGTGWGNITGGNQQDLSNPYWVGSGLTLITVSAWGCDGLQVIHWGGDGTIQAPTSGKNHTLGVVLDLTSNNAVVRVLNPTDKTKVIINMQPLSLSLSLVNALVCCARWWQHGAKANHHHSSNIWIGMGGLQERESRHTNHKCTNTDDHSSCRVPAYSKYTNGGGGPIRPSRPRHYQLHQRRGNPTVRREHLWNRNLPNQLTTVGGGV